MMKRALVLGSANLLAVAGCTVDHYLPVERESGSQTDLDGGDGSVEAGGSATQSLEEELCERLAAFNARRDAPPAVLEETEYFHGSYCPDPQYVDQWGLCIGPSSWGFGPPRDGCWEEATPRIQCLLAPETTSPEDCAPEMSDNCRPGFSPPDPSPGDELCAGGVVGVDYGGSFSVALHSRAYTDCQDGNSYLIQCQKPSAETCDMTCSCFQTDVHTKTIVLEGLDHPSFSDEAWTACEFPSSDTMGQGGADCGM